MKGTSKPKGVDLGRALKMARTAAGYSQAAAARRLGKTRLTIHNWESGKSRPSDLAIDQAAEVYHVTRDFLYELAANTHGDGAEHIGAAVPRALPQKVREWIYKFLTELVKGGATDNEVEDARILLTAPQVTSYLSGGVGRIAALNEEEIIQGLAAIGEHAIKRVLRKRGRNV